MAHQHDHHHHHHHHHGDAAAAEGPLDAANQSLADALRASFSILKFIMLVLVVMYCFSGVQCIQEHEQAVVFRFGKLLGETRDSGLSWAYPFPIDETVRFTTKLSNRFRCRSHWPNVPRDQEAQPLSQQISSGNLDPTRDGALLTADRGLVHVQWEVTYRVENLRSFVLNVAQRSEQDVQDLITAVLENSAIGVVSRYTAEEVTRGESSRIAEEVKLAVNQKLEALGTGVRLVALDIPRSSVPSDTIGAFDDVARAENERQTRIREAEQAQLRILNGVAGDVHKELIARIDELELARRSDPPDEETVARLAAEIEQLLNTRLAGDAGNAISAAKGYYTRAVQGMQGDVAEYEAMLEEYLRAPELFVKRMWEATRREVFGYDTLVKMLLPATGDEVRIKIGQDPELRDIMERRRLQEEAEKRRFQPDTGHMRIVQ